MLFYLFIMSLKNKWRYIFQISFIIFITIWIYYSFFAMTDNFMACGSYFRLHVMETQIEINIDECWLEFTVVFKSGDWGVGETRSHVSHTWFINLWHIYFLDIQWEIHIFIKCLESWFIFTKDDWQTFSCLTWS